MPNDCFDVLLLIGRPASGKSEIIDFLTHLPVAERRQRFHLKTLDIIDDFPMLWTWFEEDHILQKRLGRPALYTDAQGDFNHPALWHLLIERLSLEYDKRRRDPDYHEVRTTLVEFSRGSSHGGYRQALPHLGKTLLERAALIYVQVSFAESLRKNRLRFNPERPDSILEHGLADDKLERLYAEDDFSTLAPEGSGILQVNSGRLPYAVFENEDDVTTPRGKALAERLEQVLGRLWALQEKK